MFVIDVFDEPGGLVLGVILFDFLLLEITLLLTLFPPTNNNPLTSKLSPTTTSFPSGFKFNIPGLPEEYP